MELREADNLLEILHLETEPPGCDTAGDLRFRVRIVSGGFAGCSEYVWTDTSTFRQFLTQLREFEAQRQGTVRWEAFGSPDEFWLEFRVLDRAGHLAVFGRLQCVRSPPSHRDGLYFQTVEFAFEFCPSLLPKLVAEFERIRDPAAVCRVEN